MIHPGALDTYNSLTKETSGWNRMRIVYTLADYALTFSKGAILEIGCGESSVFLGLLSNKYNRPAYFCDFQQSVTTNAKTVPGYFGNYATVYTGKSDDFFKDVKIPELAVVFIDGEHTYEQAWKDFYNVLRLIDTNGLILLHDTLPLSDEFLDLNRCGTVYQLRQELEKDKRFDVFTFPHSAMDVGLTMVRRKPDNLKYYQT